MNLAEKELHTRHFVAQGAMKRNAEYYDNVVWERSPFTGRLIPPRCSRTSVRPPKNASRKQNSSAFPLVMLVFTLAAAGGFFLWLNSVENRERISTTDKKSAANIASVNKREDQSIEKPRSVSRVEHAPAKTNKKETEAKPATPTKENDSVVISTYEALLEKASKTRKKKDKKLLLRQAIELYPEGYEAMSHLAIILVETPKSRKEALKLAETAISIQSDSAIAWLTIAYYHHLEGRRSKALEAYKKCARSTGPKSYVDDCRRMI